MRKKPISLYQRGRLKPSIVAALSFLMSFFACTKYVQAFLSSINCGNVCAAPAMAKKMKRSKGGMLQIGSVHPHKKKWRVQIWIQNLSKYKYGPSRTSKEIADADLDILQRSGDREELQQLLPKLRHRDLQAGIDNVANSFIHDDNESEADGNESTAVEKHASTPQGLRFLAEEIGEDIETQGEGNFVRDRNEGSPRTSQFHPGA